MSEKLYKKPSAQREWYQDTTDSDHQKGSSSGTSSSRAGSNVVSLNENTITKQGFLKDFFDESSKKQSKQPRAKPLYAFSADGQSILLWIRYGACVSFYDIDSGENERKPANDVEIAAAGTNIYAFTSRHGNVLHH